MLLPKLRLTFLRSSGQKSYYTATLQHNGKKTQWETSGREPDQLMRETFRNREEVAEMQAEIEACRILGFNTQFAWR